MNPPHESASSSSSSGQHQQGARPRDRGQQGQQAQRNQRRDEQGQRRLHRHLRQAEMPPEDGDDADEAYYSEPEELARSRTASGRTRTWTDTTEQQLTTGGGGSGPSSAGTKNVLDDGSLPERAASTLGTRNEDGAEINTPPPGGEGPPSPELRPPPGAFVPGESPGYSGTASSPDRDFSLPSGSPGASVDMAALDPAMVDVDHHLLRMQTISESPPPGPVRHVHPGTNHPAAPPNAHAQASGTSSGSSSSGEDEREADMVANGERGMTHQQRDDHMLDEIDNSSATSGTSDDLFGTGRWLESADDNPAAFLDAVGGLPRPNSRSLARIFGREVDSLATDGTQRNTGGSIGSVGLVVVQGDGRRDEDVPSSSAASSAGVDVEAGALPSSGRSDTLDPDAEPPRGQGVVPGGGEVTVISENEVTFGGAQRSALMGPSSRGSEHVGTTTSAGVDPVRQEQHPDLTPPKTPHGPLGGWISGDQPQLGSTPLMETTPVDSGSRTYFTAVIGEKPLKRHDSDGVAIPTNFTPLAGLEQQQPSNSLEQQRRHEVDEASSLNGSEEYLQPSEKQRRLGAATPPKELLMMSQETAERLSTESVVVDHHGGVLNAGGASSSSSSAPRRLVPPIGPPLGVEVEHGRVQRDPVQMPTHYRQQRSSSTTGAGPLTRDTRAGSSESYASTVPPRGPFPGQSKVQLHPQQILPTSTASAGTAASSALVQYATLSLNNQQHFLVPVEKINDFSYSARYSPLLDSGGGGIEPLTTKQLSASSTASRRRPSPLLAVNSPLPSPKAGAPGHSVDFLLPPAAEQQPHQGGDDLDSRGKSSVRFRGKTTVAGGGAAGFGDVSPPGGAATAAPSTAPLQPLPPPQQPLQPLPHKSFLQGHVPFAYWLSREISGESDGPSAYYKYSRALHLEDLMRTPWRLEKTLLFGMLLCFDALLHELTFMPINVLRRLLRIELCGSGSSAADDEEEYSPEGARVGTSTALGGSSPPADTTADQSADSAEHATKVTPTNAASLPTSSQAARNKVNGSRPSKNAPSQIEKSETFRLSLLILNSLLVLYLIDFSFLYHYIRSQSFMKLYVFFNMLEIIERLLRSLGNDFFDVLLEPDNAEARGGAGGKGKGALVVSAGSSAFSRGGERATTSKGGTGQSVSPKGSRVGSPKVRQNRAGSTYSQAVADGRETRGPVGSGAAASVRMTAAAPGQPLQLQTPHQPQSFFTPQHAGKPNQNQTATPNVAGPATTTVLKQRLEELSKSTENAASDAESSGKEDVKIASEASSLAQSGTGFSLSTSGSTLQQSGMGAARGATAAPGMNRATATPAATSTTTGASLATAPSAAATPAPPPPAPKLQHYQPASFFAPLFHSFVSAPNRNFFHIIRILFTMVYCALHTIMHIVRILLLNIALNSPGDSSAMFLLIVTNNFGELKSTVFKRYDGKGLFVIMASDMVERTYLLVDILLVLARLYFSPRSVTGPLTAGGTTSPHATNHVDTNPSAGSEIAFWLSLMIGMEIGVDWFKLSFITKANSLPVSTFDYYKDVLVMDVLGSRASTSLGAAAAGGSSGAASLESPFRGVYGYAHIPVRRIGFVALPLTSMVVCHLPILLKWYPDLRTRLLLLSLWWANAVLLKIIFSILLSGYSVRRAVNLGKLPETFYHIKAL